MNAVRVKSRRTGRSGWRYRFTDPVTGSRTHRNIWIGERREADKGIMEYLAGREKIGLGLPDTAGWRTTYAQLVERFIEGAVISSKQRRALLTRVLEKNHLHIKVAADLARIEKLNAECRRITEGGKFTAHYVAFYIQRPLKQLTRWAASMGLLPYDPLAAWKQIPWGSHKKRRPFEPQEMRAIVEAAREYDSYFRHSQPSDIVFKTLLLTGNRPKAVLSARVADLGSDRLNLAPGNGKKRNGAATLPLAFVQELCRYAQGRGTNDPLLVSHEGEPVHRINLGKYFRRCMTLAFTRLEWPANESSVDPVEVAHLFYMGKHRGFDGPRPRSNEKLAARAKHLENIERVASEIEPGVKHRLLQRDMYALRATHISWARRLVNPDSVKMQVGHAPRDAEERHYLGLVDPTISSQAVWDVLTGTRSLSQVDPKVDPSANFPQNSKTRTENSAIQVVQRIVFKKKAGEGVRTLDFDLGKVALYH